MTARIFELGRTNLLKKIVIPGTLPEIFTGIRVGFSSTFVGVLFAEMFSSKQGLGFLLVNAIGLPMVGGVMALTFLLVAFAVVINLCLLAVDRRLHRRI